MSHHNNIDASVDQGVVFSHRAYIFLPEPLGGERGSVSGVVTVNGDLAEKQHSVFLAYLPAGKILSRTFSEPGTGVYTFGDLPMGHSFVAVSSDPDGALKSVAAGPLEPQHV